MHRGKRRPDVPDRVGPVWISYSFLQCLPEGLPKFVQPRAYTCFDGAEWLIQLFRRLLVGQFGKKSRFDGLPLVLRELVKRVMHEPGLLLKLIVLVRVFRRSRFNRIIRVAIDALLAVVEPYPVDCP